MKRPARLPSAAIVSIIDAVFTRILKPWYGQPSWETVKLYEEHDPRPCFRRSTSISLRALLCESIMTRESSR